MIFYMHALILVTYAPCAQALEHVVSNRAGSDGDEVRLESCDWFNLIVNFLFRELRDSPQVKK